jgi:hypothetical protein
MQIERITTKFMGILLLICFKRFVVFKASCWFNDILLAYNKFSQFDV